MNKPFTRLRQRCRRYPSKNYLDLSRVEEKECDDDDEALSWLFRENNKKDDDGVIVIERPNNKSTNHNRHYRGESDDCPSFSPIESHSPSLPSSSSAAAAASPSTSSKTKRHWISPNSISKMKNRFRKRAAAVRIKAPNLTNNLTNTLLTNASKSSTTNSCSTTPEQEREEANSTNDCEEEATAAAFSPSPGEIRSKNSKDSQESSSSSLSTCIISVVSSTRTRSSASQEDDECETSSMGIVAYEEWPVVRKQRRQRYQKNSNHHSCSFSVETVATKIGRSPIRVKFGKIDIDIDSSNIDSPRSNSNIDSDIDKDCRLLPPVGIRGRIATGRFERIKLIAEEKKENEILQLLKPNFSIYDTGRQNENNPSIAIVTTTASVSDADDTIRSTNYSFLNRFGCTLLSIC